MDELPAAPRSRKESRVYYSGLPDSPNLVARSTTTLWNGPHAVVPLWNDSTGPLRRKILEAVEGIDWNAIDMLRCGSADFNDCHLVRPVILFVSDQAESEPSTAKLNPHIPTLKEEGYRRDSIQLSEFLGTKIASCRNPTHEGTKGLYLRIRNTETAVALTCRHVVVGPEEENIDFFHDTHNNRGIIQPGNMTYQDTTEFLRNQISCYQPAIGLCESSTPVPKEQIEYLRLCKVEDESSLQRLGPFESMESRTVGHVLFSPTFGLSSSSPARFRDWALIELDQKKHQTPVKKLVNKVPETLHAISVWPEFMPWQYLVKGRKRIYCILAGDDTFTQTGVMPEAEMRCADFEFAVPGKTVVDEDFMRVCMYGSASGASHGVTNTAMSVVLRFVGSVPMVSEEWCILGSIECEKRKPFSKQGDSGASIMGDDGRVAAILTCGAQGSNREIHHISYATPIEWLLEDIRGHGYDVEWMGKEVPLDYLHQCP
ncbi:hypothetical protein FACUT_3016 [Fusarium acutatum]|uniref:Uncharacterized protein n=1 Tax=Fusarium acutatum TaxID=78861 RepID=A0A8H4NX25_9HYPO|nr:hypothetical protein FACUT_3016 [Fusarium acutatum]